jgi:hypothetical protein
LKVLYPSTTFSFLAGAGQDYFFDNVHDISFYDYKFEIKIPERVRHGATSMMSKPEICCVVELGIPFDSSLEFTWKPVSKSNSRLIGVTFQCNSGPSTNIPPDIAQKVIDCIVFEGMVPMEVMYTHKHISSITSQTYPCVTNTCRKCKPSVEGVIGVLNACAGFAGVNTGTFVMAACMYPDRVLQLHSGKSFLHYKRINPVNYIKTQNLRSFDEEEFKRWVRCIRDGQSYLMPQNP